MRALNLKELNRLYRKSEILDLNYTNMMQFKSW